MQLLLKLAQAYMCSPLAGSGQLSESELQAALVNGDWSRFDPHTVRMMIRMFDADRSGSINFDEFWYSPDSFRSHTAH
jgi:Ca2+-binding EF-hand superfamily protein